MSTPARAQKEYRQRVRRARFGLRLVRSSFRKNKSWLDRLLTRLLRKATSPADPRADFMRDEIVDAAIGFSADELEHYQRGDRR